MIQAALFDMDGVLFDTEVLGFQAMKQLSAEKGYAIDQAFYETTLGVPNAECGGIYRKALGEAFPYEEVIARFRDFFLDYVRTRPLPFKPGLVDCLSGLRERGVKIALATSTVRQLVTKYFAVMPEIGAYFDGIVCGGEVPNGKPAPDIYIAAARSVGCAPDNCIGVEDSFSGVQAIHAAGAHCVMIPDLLPYQPKFAHYVDHCLSSLNDLCPLVDRLNEAK